MIKKFVHTIISMKKDFFNSLIATTIAVFAALLLTKVLFLIAFVPTPSMENTIPAESFVVCSRFSFWGNRTPQRGDIIVFTRDTPEDSLLYTKRVVGIPGDIIEIIDGQTFINGVLYEEPWLLEKPIQNNFETFTVPEGKLFCMGDNRNQSNDSRYWKEHFINQKDVIAKAFLVISSSTNFSVSILE